MSSDSKVLVRRKRQKVPHWQFEEGRPIWRCPSNKRGGIWPTSVMLKIADQAMSYEQAEAQAAVFNAAIAAGQPLPLLPGQPSTAPLVVIQKVPVPVRAAPRRQDQPVQPGEQLTVDEAINVFTHSIWTTKNGADHQKARGYYLDRTSELWGARLISSITTDDVHKEYLAQRPGREYAADQWFSHTRATFLHARDHLFQTIRVSFKQIVGAIAQLEQRERKEHIEEFGDDGNEDVKLFSAAEIISSATLAEVAGLYGCADAIMLHTLTGLLGSQLIRLKAKRLMQPEQDGRFWFRRNKTDNIQLVEPYDLLLAYVDRMITRNRRLYPECDYLLINSRTGDRFSALYKLRDQFSFVRDLLEKGPNQKVWSGARLGARFKMPDPWPFPVLPGIAGKTLRGLRKNYCSEVVPRFGIVEGAKRTGHTMESAARMFEDHYIARNTSLSDPSEPAFAWINRAWLANNPKSRGHRELEGTYNPPKLITYQESEPA